MDRWPKCLVREGGIEPPRPYGHKILSLAKEAANQLFGRFLVRFLGLTALESTPAASLIASARGCVYLVVMASAECPRYRWIILC